MHVVDADMLGVIRVKAFPLLGGGLDDPAKQKLLSLLEAKGVAPQEVQSRVQQVVDCLGVGKVKQVLAAKDVWGALKQDATRHNLVLVSILEREAFMQQNTSSCSEDPWDLHDPWRDAADNKGKGIDNAKKGRGKGRVVGPKGPVFSRVVLKLLKWMCPSFGVLMALSRKGLLKNRCYRE